MSKSDNAIFLAASTEATTYDKDKTSNAQPASIVIRKKEDKEWQHAPDSSDDNNSNKLSGEDIHYSRYYKCTIVTISFLVSMIVSVSVIHGNIHRMSIDAYSV